MKDGREREELVDMASSFMCSSNCCTLDTTQNVCILLGTACSEYVCHALSRTFFAFTPMG